MNKVILILALLFLTSCEKDPISSHGTANSHFKVDYLFEIDGLKVYRFHDNGYVHYFTTRGNTIASRKVIRKIGKGNYVRHIEENINGDDEE